MLMLNGPGLPGARAHTGNEVFPWVANSQDADIKFEDKGERHHGTA